MKYQPVCPQMKSSTMITETWVHSQGKEVTTAPLSFYESNMPDDAMAIRREAAQGKTSYNRVDPQPWQREGIYGPGKLTFEWTNPKPANRKKNSIFDRYTVATLREFAERYEWRKKVGNLSSWQHCAACAAVGTLCTEKEWNTEPGVAYFDDALAIAARLDANLLDIDLLEMKELETGKKGLEAFK